MNNTRKHFSSFVKSDYFFVWLYYIAITSYALFTSISNTQFNNGYVSATLYLWFVSGWIVPVSYFLKTFSIKDINTKIKSKKAMILICLNAIVFPIMFYVIEVIINVIAETIYDII